MMKFTYFVCVYNFINVNYVGPICSIDHYNFGGSHASDIISLRGITNHVLCVMHIYFAK